MLKNVLECFMKLEVIKSILSMKDVRTEANFSAKNITLDFDIIKIIRKVNINTADMLHFRQDCKKCLLKFISVLMTRSSLTYPLTNSATCLDPSLIASNLDLAKKRFT